MLIQDGWTALHIAASFDAVEMMQILVDKLLIDVNAVDNVSSSCFRRLRMAASNQLILLQAGDTALHKAARNGFIDSIQFLRFVVECDDTIVNHVSGCVEFMRLMLSSQCRCFDRDKSARSTSCQ